MKKNLLFYKELKTRSEQKDIEIQEILMEIGQTIKEVRINTIVNYVTNQDTRCLIVKYFKKPKS